MKTDEFRHLKAQLRFVASQIDRLDQDRKDAVREKELARSSIEWAEQRHKEEVAKLTVKIEFLTAENAELKDQIEKLWQPRAVA